MIGKRAFKKCESLKEFTIPKKVEKIEKELQDTEQLQSTIDTLKKKINPQTYHIFSTFPVYKMLTLCVLM